MRIGELGIRELSEEVKKFHPPVHPVFFFTSSLIEQVIGNQWSVISEKRLFLEVFCSKMAKSEGS